MRECARVLAPGGRVALFVIHTPPGLSPSEREAAAELGPSLVASAHPLPELLERPGFTEVSIDDRTAAFSETCERILRVRRELEGALREEEGDDVFEEEVRKKQAVLAGIAKGLLVRSLATGVVTGAPVGHAAEPAAYIRGPDPRSSPTA